MRACHGVAAQSKGPFSRRAIRRNRSGCFPQYQRPPDPHVRQGNYDLSNFHILEVVERLVHSFALIVHGEIVCSQTVEETIESGRTLEDIYFQYVTRRPVEEFEWLG